MMHYLKASTPTYIAGSIALRARDCDRLYTSIHPPPSSFAKSKQQSRTMLCDLCLHYCFALGCLQLTSAWYGFVVSH